MTIHPRRDAGSQPVYTLITKAWNTGSSSVWSTRKHPASSGAASSNL